LPDLRRTGGMSYRGAVAALLVIGAFVALLAIPIGNWSGTSASASYYYYNPGGSPPVLTLTPAAATNDVGTTHTLTATVTQDGGPLEDVTVRFTVTGSVTTSGNCTTDSNGQCTFTYAGPSLPGADLITAFADVNGNGTRDTDEPTATATKAWVLPTSTPGQVTGGGQIVVGGDKVTFGFTAKSTSGGLKGECNVIDHDTRRMIRCRDVTALVQTGSEAWIYGHATDNGADTTYVIHVVDNREPGSGADTFSITTASGYSASGTLTSGNIQAH
jgi:hypothetical protein